MYDSGYLTNTCCLQFEKAQRFLGTYELEEDAARAHDKVARILGRGLNFPNSDALDIIGPRPESADKAVAVAVEAAQKFKAAGGSKQTSVYVGISKDKRNKTNPWKAKIEVSSRVASVRTYACVHTTTTNRGGRKSQ